MRYVFVVFVCFAVLLATVCEGSVPRVMSYQGRLTGPTGQVVSDGAYNLRFCFYDAASGGNLLWQDPPSGQSALSAQVSKGLFSVSIGSAGNPVPDAALQGSTWLQVEVNGAVMSGRTQIAASGYALRAATAEGIALPFSGTASMTSDIYAAFEVTNTGKGYAGRFISSGAGYGALVAQGDMADYGLLGTITDGAAVYGVARGRGIGVFGTTSGTGYGGFFTDGSSTVIATALQARGFGTGATVFNAEKAGTKGSAGIFSITNAANSDAALSASTTGTGYAGQFVGKLRVQGVAEVDGFKMGGPTVNGAVLTVDATGNGTWKLPAVSAWGLTGNSATDPATCFIGTTDNKALNFKVNSIRALSIVPGTSSGSDTANLVGGYSGNSVGAVRGSVICGGGLATYANTIQSSFSFLGGGLGNSVKDVQSVLCGGEQCAINAGGEHSFVGGGIFNSTSARHSVIGGGEGCTIAATADHAVIAGGYSQNAVGSQSAIGGGHSNSANGHGATVPGGESNTADKDYTFAAGQRAKANHTGSFVWADSQAADFATTASNQFLIRAGGGVGIGVTDPMADSLSVKGSVLVDCGQTNHGPASTYDLRPALLFGAAGSGEGIGSARTGSLNVNGLDFYTGYVNRLCIANGSGNVGIHTTTPSYTLAVNGIVAASSFVNLSDARYKKNIAPIADAMGKLQQLRGVRFDWDKSKAPGLDLGDGRQVGLIAQEVQRVLPELVSTSPDGILSVSYSGVIPVLVEAVKAQEKTIRAQESTIATLRTKLAEVDRLRAEFEALKAELVRR